MNRILSSQLSQHIGEQVRIRGWMNNVRLMGRLGFLILRDRHGLVQVVVDSKEDLKRLQGLQPGSILTVVGQVQSAPKTAFSVEIIQPTLDIEVPIAEAPEIEYYKPEIPNDLEFILDHRPMALRNRQLQAVFRLQAEIVHAFRLYMHDVVGAVEYFAPNILGASSEGGAEFFTVDYFGYPATLAQSSQLYKQMMVGVNERVFALMPFFRAERSHTSRHLTEGKQFEFEMGFFDHWHEILDIQEGCLKAIVSHLHQHCAQELATLNVDLVKAPPEIPFPRITFAEAQEIFFQRTGKDERAEPDLSPAAERELCQYALETYGTDALFVIDWRTSKRPFYAYPNDEHPELSNTFDLLCAGTEITSGGQRRHTYASMVEGIKSKGMDPANFTDYLSIFKYGMPLHGGFGMGLERLTMTLLRLKNIREASLFPSDPKRIAGNRIRSTIFFGGENLRNEIIRQMRQGDVVFRQVSHALPSPSDTAHPSGFSKEKAVKAIIVRGKGSKKNYAFNIPGHLQLDMKAVAQLVGEKCEFEDPQAIQERFGISVGSVPPFGNLLNLDTFFDDRIEQACEVVFSSGQPGESLVVNAKDLFQLIQPKLGHFSKEPG